MTDETSKSTLMIATEKRVLNEFGAKILNEERMEKVVESRRNSRTSEHAEMLFACECDDKDCTETITMPTGEYKNLHRKTKYFMVVPSHVRLDLEEIITSFTNYALVAKYFPHPRTSD